MSAYDDESRTARLRALEERLAASAGRARRSDGAERAARRHAARGARAHRRAQGGGREAHPAAVRLRHLPRHQRRRHRRHLHRAAARCASRCTPRSRSTTCGAARRSCSTRRSTSSLARELRASPARSSCSRSCSRTATAPWSSGAPTRSASCELADAADRRAAARRRHAADGAALAAASRADPPARGRGARPRRGARHRLRRRRRPRRRRSSRSTTRSSCRTCTPTCSTSTSCQPPKGILLYGPPGCGKTLIAKAVANSLAKKVAEKTGNAEGRSYFLNIKGPELLNKYVGETERQIRLVFQRAREKATRARPSSCSSTRWTRCSAPAAPGISSDIETTIVPQLLGEIDGVESLKNVIVIGASNREDLIDPAILRPGRLDVKIKIERPDAEAAPRDLHASTSRPTCRCTPTTSPSTAASPSATVAGDDRARGRARCTPRARRTSSSRSRTRTATRRSCTSRTSPPAP